MILADSETRRQLSTAAARGNDCSATQVTSVLCKIWRPSRNLFFAIKVILVGSQFLTDFDSQNRCLCSRRSHGPLLRAFGLCFHFKQCLPVPRHTNKTFLFAIEMSLHTPCDVKLCRRSMQMPCD